MLNDLALRLRLAAAADAPEIAALVERAYAAWIPVIGRKPVPMEADYAAALASNRFDLVVRDGRIQALIETSAQEDHLLILNVAVEPALHGQGLGRRLLGHAEGLALSLGLGVLRLYTHELYERNIRLYRRLGYEVERLEPFRGAQTVHMIRRLGAPAAADLRVCFFGDSFTHGTGDDEALGWVGRLAAEARRAGAPLTAYNLGIRRDSSADLRARWREEAARRLADGCDGRLVFAFGVNDAWGDDGGARLSLEESAAHARAILEAALASAPCLVLGPLAVTGESARDARVEAFGERLKALCAELGAPFLDAAPIAERLRGRWRAEADAGDGAHPNGASYAALAEAISAWPAWRAWVGL